MKQKFDPNLREAVEEIRAICKRRDIGAHVLLASPTHTEYAMLYDIATWSAISFEQKDDMVGIRIRAKASVPGDKEKLDASVHMVFSFRDLLTNGIKVHETLMEMLRKKLRILHVNMVGETPDSWPGKRE